MILNANTTSDEFKDEIADWLDQIIEDKSKAAIVYDELQIPKRTISSYRKKEGKSTIPFETVIRIASATGTPLPAMIFLRTLKESDEISSTFNSILELIHKFMLLCKANRTYFSSINSIENQTLSDFLSFFLTLPLDYTSIPSSLDLQSHHVTSNFLAMTKLINKIVLSNCNNSELSEGYMSIISSLIEDYVSCFSKDFPIETLSNVSTYKTFEEMELFKFLQNETIPDSIRRTLGEEL